MIYLLGHNKQNFFGRNFLKILAIFLAAAVLFLIFNISGPMHSFISGVFSPLFRTGNLIYENLNRIPKFFSDKNKIIEENEKLLSELENLRRNTVDYESIKYENQRLRQELVIKPAGDFISASVIAKPPQIPLDSLFLDKGTKDGIAKGASVLGGQRILVGRVAEVGKSTATVTLSSFAEIVSYGFVSRTSEPLEMKGVGGGSMEAKVPIDFDIVVGDKIMISRSLDYLAAFVGVVEEDSSSGFKDILMSLPANVSKINTVFIEPYASE